MSIKENNQQDLVKRIDYLEDVNRWYRFATEILAQMSELYIDSDSDNNVNRIADTAIGYIKRLYHFDSMAFYTVSQSDADFNLTAFEPCHVAHDIQHWVDALIDSGQFAWALNQSKAVRVVEKNDVIFLHALTSKSGIQGMFVGITTLEGEKKGLTDGALNLLSVILYNTACAIESSNLYTTIRAYNDHLQKTVQERTDELEYQHKHDRLTGLPNRLLFSDRLEQSIDRAERRHEMLVVIVIDLDMFKLINDSLGHELGDCLLQEVSHRLQETLRVTDTVARLQIDDSNITVSRFGGDEFTLLIPDAKSTDDILTVIRRLVESISKPFIIQGQSIYLTSSIGISIYPNDGQDATTLLKNADAAMHHAKSEGRNNYQFYATDIQKHSLYYLSMATQLHKALDKQQFELHYQPQLDLRKGRVTGLEALIRWVQDDGTVVNPDKFIPICEDTGLILPIGEWVLNTACEFCHTLTSNGLTDIQIAVNLSAKQFRQGDLAQRISSILQKNLIGQGQIELEITEGTIIQDVDATIATLSELHDMGLALSIDDFGTGYSSLSYLKQFPVDALKIDRSFLRDIYHNKDDAAIVRAIVALAHSLNLSVISEGVESQQQLDFLIELECELAQGFFISKPLPAEQLIPFVQSFHSSIK